VLNKTFWANKEHYLQLLFHFFVEGHARPTALLQGFWTYTRKYLKKASSRFDETVFFLTSLLSSPCKVAYIVTLSL
jgi:hypothetical protein